MEREPHQMHKADNTSGNLIDLACQDLFERSGGDDCAVSKQNA
jgi:hypothetical protein